MRRLRVGILDLIGNRPTPGLWNRLMKPNFASIMPQVLAVWSEQMGHDVRFVCHTGAEDLTRELPAELDVLFIAAFTNAAQRAAAISCQYRAGGTVTAVGGPHARCYPQDAARYFDYVLGFTDQALLGEVLRDCAPHRPLGLMLSAKKQPPQLPGVRERWKFIEPTIAKAPALKLVPMIGSLGCPYTCSFCIDSEVEYQPLARDQIQEDLRFLLKTLKRPCVAWHDPNFGIRFEETMAAIEEVVPPGAIDFAAESSLSILSEPHLRRLKKNGFKAILPGIESWYGMDGKSKEGGPGLGTREPDPALHPLRSDELRPRARRRRGRRAVRAHEALRREDAGRFPGLLALLGLRPGRSAQPRAAAGGTGTSLPLPLPRQQPGDERAAEQLLLAGLLRPPHRPTSALVLGARHRAPFRSERGLAHPLLELRARRLDRGQRPRPPRHDDPSSARLRPLGSALLRG